MEKSEGDFSLHRTRGAFQLEKWYVDTLLDDGAVLLVYLGRLRIAGIDLGRLTAQFFPAAGTGPSGTAVVRRARCHGGTLEFGPARMSDLRLSWVTPGLSGELEFTPLHLPAGPAGPLLAQRGRSLNWRVEVPDADVRGEIRWPGGGRPLRGRGYRDRVWFDLPPWRFPLRELFWGRAAGGGQAAFWMRARTSQGELRFAWANGRPLDRWELPEFSRTRVLLAGGVADQDNLRLGPWRPLLRRLTGNLRETKYAAAAVLAGEPARAIFESVCWR